MAVFFGDGAIDEGAFWESLNMACLRQLPMIFVCEDNGFAVHTPAEARHGYKNISDIVRTFNCRVFESESTDVEELYHLTRSAVESMKTERMPCFFHFRYYRYLEHVGVFEDFKAGYRSRQEFEKWQKRDPVNLQRERLVLAGFKEQVEAIEREVTEMAQSALDKAKAAAYPDASILCEGLWV